MKDEKKAPKLRFKGFTDDWEQRKLGDVADRVTTKNKGMVSELPLTISAKDGLISQDEFFNKKVASKDLSSYLLLHHGDFAYNKSYSNGYPFGTIKRLEKYPQGVVSSLYIAFKPNSSISSDFMAQYYESNNWHKEIYKCAAEGARNHGLLNVPPSDFFATNLNIPITKSEQLKIGRLLNAVNQIITLHEEKKCQLERLKSALLQKMFANKSGYPAIRFSNFGDKWKQYKLSDIGEIFTGSTPPRQHPEYYSENGVLWVTPTDITDNLISDTAKKLSVSGTRAGQVVPAGSILVTCIASIGKNALLLTKGSFNQQINCIVPNSNKFDSYFLLTESFNWLDPMRRIAGAGTMQIVNKNNFSKINTLIPELEEQIVIGNIFSKLDSLIALYKQKIEKINILKQWLLQNMFI